MKNSLVFWVVLIVLMGCKSSTNTNSKPVGDNSRVSIDWNGRYTGQVPCASCEGIATQLWLNPNNTYTLKEQYLGEGTKPIVHTGNFKWDEDGSTIQLLGGRDLRYLVGENRLWQLDKAGKKVEGDLANRYILQKKEASLAHTKWTLTELYGQPMNNGQVEAFITFNAQDASVTGNSGCNTFRGSYETMALGKIAFKQIVGTRMACPSLEIESQFLKVLNEVDSYVVQGDSLMLTKARMAPLARFEIGY